MRDVEDRRSAAGPALMRWIVPAATALLLAGCQQAAEDAAAPAAETAEAAQLTPAQQAFAEANTRMHAAMSEIPPNADEAFMRGMLAHHRGAVEMAEVELEHGTDPQARDLAQRIIDAQEAEIAEMEAWLAEHGVSAEPATGVSTGMDHAGH